MYPVLLFHFLQDGLNVGRRAKTPVSLLRFTTLLAEPLPHAIHLCCGVIHRPSTPAKKAGRKIGICGQAPSDFPDFVAFLVECGIYLMSLTPDTTAKTRLIMADKEKELGIYIRKGL